MEPDRRRVEAIHRPIFKEKPVVFGATVEINGERWPRFFGQNRGVDGSVAKNTR